MADGGVLDDIFANPDQLAGKGLGEVKTAIGAVDSPWVEGTLGKGTHAGPGWTVRESLPGGGFSDRYLQWHPGGGRHGPDPYWKVSSAKAGTQRFPSCGV